MRFLSMKDNVFEDDDKTRLLFQELENSNKGYISKHVLAECKIFDKI